jgi:hypothetical protein
LETHKIKTHLGFLRELGNSNTRILPISPWLRSRMPSQPLYHRRCLIGWIGRGLGDFGAQTGQAYDLNLDWKTRLQNLAMEQARQKIQDVQAPLQLQLLQEQLKKLQQPTYEGTASMPGGGLGAITYDQNTGTPKINPLIPSYITPDAVGRQILNGRQSLSPQDQFYADQLMGELQMGVDPSKVLDKWLQFVPSAVKAQKQKPPVVDVNKGTVAVFDAFGNGTEYPIYDAKGNVNPNLPPDIQQLVASQVSAQNTVDQRKANDEERRSQQVLDRMNKSEEFRQKQVDAATAEKDANTAVSEFINAFTKYRSASDNQSKVSAASRLYNPFTWGNAKLFQPGVDDAQIDAEGKRVDAIQKLKDAGMPVPAWLLRPIGAPAGTQGSPTDLPGVTQAQ